MREKGATEFDKLCHKIFDANVKNYRARYCGVRCGCGHELEVYYCEEQLYLVECEACESKALIKARSSKEAAYKTFACEVLPVEDMGEECAVFFGHTPIDEPPVYVGLTIDCDFPEDVVCGMYLPCPGTDGNELKKGDCDVHPDQ